MKRLYSTIICFLFSVVALLAQNLQGTTIYVNPGHGGFDSDDRNITIAPFKADDQSMHFSDNIENNKLSFPYLLKHGSPDKRNAIKILELYNFPQEIVSDAFNTVNIQVS